MHDRWLDTGKLYTFGLKCQIIHLNITMKGEIGCFNVFLGALRMGNCWIIIISFQPGTRVIPQEIFRGRSPRIFHPER